MNTVAHDHGKTRTDRTVFRQIDTPLGPMVAGASSEGVCMLEFGDQETLETRLRRVAKRLGNTPIRGEHPLVERLTVELDEYFRGTRKRFDVPLVLAGTPFQERVWRALLRIPYGETISYDELAKRVGSPRGQRAVGSANGDNRLAIVVPCHRVVRTGGALGGYGGGLPRKQWLLDLERGTRQETLFDV